MGNTFVLQVRIGLSKFGMLIHLNSRILLRMSTFFFFSHIHWDLNYWYVIIFSPYFPSGHSHEVTCCKFYKNNFIVSASSDNTVRIWNVMSGEEKWVYYCEGGILGLEVAEDIIIIGDSSGQLYYLMLNNILLC